VKAITKSTLNKELLQKYNGRGLLSPSQTRWVFTYYVIDRLIESKEAVAKVVAENDLIDVALEPLKWKQMEQIRDLLHPFATVVRELEGDRYSTLSQVIPALIDMIEIMGEKAKVGSIVGKIAAEIKQELERRFEYIFNSSHGQFQPAYMLATFFDPRFVIGLTNDQQLLCIDLVLRSLSTYGYYATQGHQQTPDQDTGESTSAKPKKYGGFFKKAHTEMAVNPLRTDDHCRLLKTKLEAYVTERIDAGDEVSNETRDFSLQYWYCRRDTHKEIAKFAMDLLVVPASSAGIERVFSMASIVQGGRRFRLGAENTENELMIKVNKYFLMD